MRSYESFLRHPKGRYLFLLLWNQDHLEQPSAERECEISGIILTLIGFYIYMWVSADGPSPFHLP